MQSNERSQRVKISFHQRSNSGTRLKNCQSTFQRLFQQMQVKLQKARSESIPLIVTCYWERIITGIIQATPRALPQAMCTKRGRPLCLRLSRWGGESFWDLQQHDSPSGGLTCLPSDKWEAILLKDHQSMRQKTPGGLHQVSPWFSSKKVYEAWKTY